jgi:hypothetical protein
MGARFRAAPWLCGLIVAGGCTWPNQGPAAHQDQPENPEPLKPALTVQKPIDDAPAEPAEAVDQRILDYVRNIDGLARRVNRDPSGSSDPGREVVYIAPPHLAADAQESPIGVNPIPPARTTERPASVTFEPAVAAEADLPSGGSAEGSEGSATAAAPDPSPSPLKPPVLAKVDVRGERVNEISDAVEPAEPVSVNAPAAANHPVSLKDFLARQTARPGDPTFQQQLDTRLLHAAAGDYEKARQPLELVSDEQQQMAARFVEAYIALRERTLGEDPTQAATAALREIEQLADALRPLSDLSIPTLVLCRAVRGYGQYDVIDPPKFPTGSPIEFVTYCEVRCFATEPQPDGTHQARFDMRTAILTREGTPVLNLDDRDIVDRCRSLRRDCFIPRLVRLPATLSPGQYVAKVTIIDKLAQKVAERRATFSVTAVP